MKLAIVGYGKMGHLIERLAPEYGFDVPLWLNRGNNGHFEGLSAQSLRGIDVAVEFSIPEAAARNVEGLANVGVNVVSGTTGWEKELNWVRAAVERNGTALVGGRTFLSASMSSRRLWRKRRTSWRRR